MSLLEGERLSFPVSLAGAPPCMTPLSPQGFHLRYYHIRNRAEHRNWRTHCGEDTQFQSTAVYKIASGTFLHRHEITLAALVFLKFPNI